MAGNKMELKAHEGTYSGFITLLKVGTAVSVVVAAIVVLLIAN
ncbi:aa3-type cytochrome c oxidase subunit IV [Sphingomonas solaris]|uniref:Aa3-type cytochrome c oxidase subunit IV n=1 Tax=Alterirhizorhabdus solaris TaxID=2529389 RepID=A0A558R373_9SPHN|nr:aa3-type cytochrome c oxidase subunit IV [Sphingomonas solaris]TVV73843.1 aa3-type cytochrome c oxidase subunit IV [Sphingomonas solaris]